MNIIILSDRLSAPARWTITSRRAMVLAGSVLALAAVVSALVFFAGHRAGYAHNAAAGEIAQLRAELTEHEARLADVRAASQRDLNAMALRVAELKAESTRLNALGERLTVVGKLTEGEFNFNETPGVGGPQPLMPAEPIRSDDFLRSLSELELQFAQQSEQLSIIENFLLGREVERDLLPAGWPVAVGYISSHFGTRTDPFTGGRDSHTGVDFSGKRGDPIHAVADGVVSFAGMHFGYGYMVEIDHGNGYRTRYAHNSENLVKVGEVVKAQQRIAKMGATGRATGVHLHFEVWHNDRPVNPMTFVRTARDEPAAS